MGETGNLAMRRFRVLLILGMVLLALCYGMVAGHYKWPPFTMLTSIKQSLVEAEYPEPADVPDEYQKQEVLLKFAFTDPLLPGDQLLPAIGSLSDIHRANESIAMPVEYLFDAFERLEIGEAETVRLNNGEDSVLKVSYTLGGKEYFSYAYAPPQSSKKDKVVLVIPGSGFNQSTRVYRREPGGLHDGILDAFDASFDEYVLVKPNEDCRAFHNGRNKLSNAFVVNWHLDHGYSSSASYVVDSLALAKYLKGRYDNFVVCGISQGGRACLLNALQSKPRAAIIMSGYTVLSEAVMRSHHDQLIIPGWRQRLNNDRLKQEIRASSTRFLFTYGLNDKGPMIVDVHECLTAKHFRDCANVQVSVHNGGHECVPDTISAFLADIATGAP